jgi:hypothetical protein
MARKSLLTLRSNLRELKYSSPKRQPYIYTPLPAYNESGPNAYMGPDLMGRNGRSFAAEQDFTRFSRFFSDKSNAAGLFFTTKQNSLEKTAPKTPYGPARAYNPANTLAQIAASGTGLHLDKRGLTPDVSGRQKYEKATNDRFNSDDTNRLTLLYKHKIGGQPGGGGAFRIAKNEDNTLIRYGGGPNSLGGIGFTTLKRYTNTNKGEEIKSTFTLQQEDYGLALKSTSTGFSGQFGAGLGISNFILDIQNSNPTKANSEEGKKVLGRLTNYANFNRAKTFGTGDPGQKVDLQAYYDGVPKDSEGRDKINALGPLVYSSKAELKQAQIDDMIKFNMSVLDNNDPSKKTYVQFRAYIKNFQDNYSGEWDNFKYLGRAEDFYKYKGFSRRISLDFDVHIASRIDLFPVYNKLNYLASLTAPDYSDEGYMRGNIIQLTVGDYINNTYGIMTGFDLGIPEEATWEIARKDDGTPDKYTAELPTLINVRGFEFKPIHNFVPQLVKNHTNPEAKFISLGSNSKGYPQIPGITT